MTVKELADIAGISVRTLQYYDDIGLLVPSGRAENGYRVYNEENARKLKDILFFRELKFSLREIREILSDPFYDREKALLQQIRMLQIRREHLDELIALAEKELKTGGNVMELKAFNNDKIEKYKEEAKKAWGNTSAYAEYETRHKDYSNEQEQSLGNGLMDILAAFHGLEDPGSDAAQDLVRRLQAYITENYYTCTKEILAGLGEMYAAGGEFTENIDRAGGIGTAQTAAEAIRFFCK